jgi:hypothetical protein
MNEQILSIDLRKSRKGTRKKIVRYLRSNGFLVDKRKSCNISKFNFLNINKVGLKGGYSEKSINLTSMVIRHNGDLNKIKELLSNNTPLSTERSCLEDLAVGVMYLGVVSLIGVRIIGMNLKRN